MFFFLLGPFAMKNALFSSENILMVDVSLIDWFFLEIIVKYEKNIFVWSLFLMNERIKDIW